MGILRRKKATRKHLEERCGKRTVCFKYSWKMDRGVARNLLRGTKEGFWGRKSPSGVQGQSADRFWGAKLETHTEYSTN